MLAISTDDVETQKKFRESLKAPFPFLSDAGGKVAKQYGGTTFGFAARVSYVVGQDGKIQSLTEGGDAIDASRAIGACPLKHAAEAAKAAAPPK